MNSQIIVKSRRLSMSIPSKRALSADSETKEGPNPQKTKKDKGESTSPKTTESLIPQKTRKGKGESTSPKK